jgi:hypothetical protein
MELCGHTFGLEDWSNLISIVTPVILLFWFYYSLKQNLSKDYFKEVDGIYAGFTTPIATPNNGGQMYSGVIMNIRTVDNKGFYKGDFDFAETESCTINGQHMFNQLNDGVYSFFGDTRFRLHFDKKRHPFRTNENRTYKGSLFVVAHMSLPLDNTKLEDYLIAEYNVIHFRERESIKLTIKKIHRTGAQTLPTEILLHKSSGLTFEPYKNLKQVVFKNNTRVDK